MWDFLSRSICAQRLIDHASQSESNKRSEWPAAAAAATAAIAGLRLGCVDIQMVSSFVLLWPEFGNVIEVGIFSPPNVAFLISLWTDLAKFLGDL